MQGSNPRRLHLLHGQAVFTTELPKAHMKSRLSTQQVDNLCRSEPLPGSGHEPAHSSAFPLNLSRHLVSSPGHLHPAPHSPHLCPKMPLAPPCARHAHSPRVYQRLSLHSSNHFQHYSCLCQPPTTDPACPGPHADRIRLRAPQSQTQLSWGSITVHPPTPSLLE